MKNNKDVRLDERDDYNMIARAAGVAFSRLQDPVIPPWVNRAGSGETSTDWSAESREYTRQLQELQEEADDLRTLSIFLGMTLAGFAIVACMAYQMGWIIH